MKADQTYGVSSQKKLTGLTLLTNLCTISGDWHPSIVQSVLLTALPVATTHTVANVKPAEN